MNNSEKIIGVEYKKLVRHHDDRGFFEELLRKTDPIFKEGFGQLSRSSMKKGVIKAWHIHRTQIDWWYASSGTLQVGLYDNRENSGTYKVLNTLLLGENGEEAILKIPPGVAHGLKVKSEGAELFYVTSGIYNPKEEEGRIAENDATIGFDWNIFAPQK